MSKNIIILQHIPIETPGYILDLMIKDGMNLKTIELDAGEKIPDDLNELAAEAATQWTGTFNPRTFDVHGARSIYELAW